MTYLTAERLERAVLAVAADIANMAWLPTKPLSESRLWRELICCVLSSQVLYETALAAARAVVAAGVLKYRKSETKQTVVENRIRAILQSPLATGNHGTCRFRFPNAKARHLAKTIRTMRENDVSLAELTYADISARDKRKLLIDLVCGFGPKQASMFMRNVGAANDLAILDTHTLRYLVVQNLWNASAAPVNLVQYERVEHAFHHYASDVGVSIGELDFAIWIVMRTAAAERLL